MDIFQAQAICEMAEARHQYNLGVLSMLGKRSLAEGYTAVSHTIAMLVEDRNKLIPDDAGMFDTLPDAAAAIQQRINEASARQAAAWAPIQEIIDQARAILGRQAVLP